MSKRIENISVGLEAMLATFMGYVWMGTTKKQKILFLIFVFLSFTLMFGPAFFYSTYIEHNNDWMLVLVVGDFFWGLAFLFVSWCAIEGEFDMDEILFTKFF